MCRNYENKKTCPYEGKCKFKCYEVKDINNREGINRESQNKDFLSKEVEMKMKDIENRLNQVTHLFTTQPRGIPFPMAPFPPQYQFHSR